MLLASVRSRIKNLVLKVDKITIAFAILFIIAILLTMLSLQRHARARISEEITKSSDNFDYAPEFGRDSEFDASDNWACSVGGSDYGPSCSIFHGMISCSDFY